jgi:hypothetical protein
MSIIEKAWAKILAIGLIALGIIDLIFYFSEGSVNFLNWMAPGSLVYVMILFIIGIFLVWKRPVQGDAGTQVFNIFREKLVGVLILMLLFFEYYLATNPATFLGENILYYVGITNYLGHGILTIILGIIVFYDPYKRIVGLTPYTSH